MRVAFTSEFHLFVSVVLTQRSPQSLSVISSGAVTSIFNAIPTFCFISSLSLTGDICLWEGMLHYILQNHSLFPCLAELYYHCSPPPSFSTHYTFYHIPTSLRPPLTLPSPSRFISIFIHLPVFDIEHRVCNVRRFYIHWNLYRPHASEVVTTIPMSQSSL